MIAELIAAAARMTPPPLRLSATRGVETPDRAAWFSATNSSTEVTAMKPSPL